MSRQVGQHRLVFGSDVELISNGGGVSGRDHHGRAGIADNVVAGSGLARSKPVGVIRIRDPSADEIMLQHRNPTASEIGSEGVFGHILKVELGKSLVGLC